MKAHNLPGFDKAIHWTPVSYYCHGKYDDEESLYPNALQRIGGEYKMTAITLRELAMLQFMDHVTDKPNWVEKVFEERIKLKWKAELMAQGENVFSESMFDYAIRELQHKAKVWKETSTVTAYDPGIVKSDSIVAEKVLEALKQAVRPLEDIPVLHKDWHPGSNGKILDLVHPSLFPLIYGRTKFIPDHTVDVKDPVAASGQGSLLCNDLERLIRIGSSEYHSHAISETFQWLPCEMQFTKGEDKDGRQSRWGKLEIKSYINNLHPHSHPELYAIIEEITSCALPLWNRTLSSLLLDSRRIEYCRVDYYDFPEEEKPKQEPEENDNDFWDREHAEIVSLREKYIIFPEPAYTNEHICATALYYYDCVNITESRLSFRQSVSDPQFRYPFRHEQWDHVFLPKIFGKENGDDAVQELGSIACKEGRLLTFPNTLQHRVQPFELADKSKPGHRKILALFLVDPHMKIISTANVPPQQKEWWAEELWDTGALGNIPREIHEHIIDQVDEPMSMKEAKEWRLKLMEGRKNFVTSQDEIFSEEIFSLCEH